MAYQVCMWLISHGETVPEIRYRPRSMTYLNISDGNKRTHSAGMDPVSIHLQDSRRPQIRGSTISSTLVPTSCTSRVVGDSERDPLYLELIHPVIGEAATAQYSMIIDQSYTAQRPYRPIIPYQQESREFYK